MNKKIPFLSLLLVVTLSACTQSTSLEFVPYESDVSFGTIKSDEEGDGYSRSSTYETLTYYSSGTETTLDDFRDLYSSGYGYRNAPSEGNIYALVIPINFTDSDTSENEKQKIIIQNAFFGDSSKNIYESVAAYYDYSSYGQLKIDGFVTDFYTYPAASTALGNGTSSVSKLVGGYALNWFYETYPDFDTSLFDQDGDGYIDCLYLVYNHEKASDSESSTSLWWAYTDHMSVRSEYNNTAPYGNSYVWISYDFLDGGNNYAETHTLIHETGHLYGLADYYNTSGGNYQPTGYSDMMDRNLGDHTGYSKMLLNWTTPYVVNDSCTITIEPFYSSGDLILIPTSKGWNGTPYDEYLLLEFYVPEGLNKDDAGTKYYYTDKSGETGIFTFFESMGLKVYHVDSRIGYFDLTSTRQYICDIDDEDALSKISEYQRYFINFINDNSISDSKVSTDDVLYHLLQVDETNTFTDNIPAESKDLWKTGDSFGIDTFTDFSFNNGASLEYTFTVDSMSKEGITITFTKK